MPQPTQRPASRGKRIVFTLVMVCLPFVLLALIEGTASFALFARAVRRDRVAEEVHTERDTLLGWINLPDVSRPDMYAKGIGLHTNHQRFRHRGEVTATPAPGTRRVICSGDSFTLGFGVGDAENWCALLASDHPGIESINMGQGGYGLDQAYLWYLRDGLGLHPDVQIFAFILADFGRMRYTRLNGYPKPQLARSGDTVRAIGVPVPSPGLGPLFQRMQNASRGLRTFALFNALMGDDPRWSDPAITDSATWEVARAALRDLARRDSIAGVKLEVVFLPMADDYKGENAVRWRRWAKASADRGEFAYVDLIDSFRRMAPDSVDAMFLTEDAIAFHGAAGHYTVRGNRWVADQLNQLSVISGPGDAGP
ncbi:MAG: hypothetical protein V4558_02930 [Gemmatimonadota bacterium]